MEQACGRIATSFLRSPLDALETLSVGHSGQQVDGSGVGRNRDRFYPSCCSAPSRSCPSPTEASFRDHLFPRRRSVRQSGRVPTAPSRRAGPGLVTPAMYPGRAELPNLPPTAHNPAERGLEAGGGASASWGVSWGFLLARDLMVVSGWGSRSIMPQQTLDVHFRGRSEPNLAWNTETNPATRLAGRFCPLHAESASLGASCFHQQKASAPGRGSSAMPCRQPGFHRLQDPSSQSSQCRDRVPCAQVSSQICPGSAAQLVSSVALPPAAVSWLPWLPWLAWVPWVGRVPLRDLHNTPCRQRQIHPSRYRIQTWTVASSQANYYSKCSRTRGRAIEAGG